MCFSALTCCISGNVVKRFSGAHENSKVTCQTGKRKGIGLNKQCNCCSEAFIILGRNLQQQIYSQRWKY